MLWGKQPFLVSIFSIRWNSNSFFDGEISCRNFQTLDWCHGFWQVDNQGKVRTGKVMLYYPETGKRVKEPYNHISWVHSLIPHKDFNLCQCFFGEHLINKDKTRPIALVESEKTALIASYYLPQFLWIASGGKNGCFNTKSLSVLKTEMWSYSLIWERQQFGKISCQWCKFSASVQHFSTF